ncbi:MAG TPA: S8 family serine peptidase, partial [Sphingomonas sp.]|nr:S8 family serine peptidase [Sphingomonas sp.]
MRVKAMRWLIGGLIALGVPAGAQLLPGLGSGPLGGLTGPLLGPPTAAPAPMLGAPVARSLDWLGGIARDASPASLLTLRRERLRALVDDYPRELDTDDHGNPIRRGEIVGIGLSPRSLAKALAAGFSLLRREAVSGIGIDLTVLAPPKHEHARDAIGKLRKLDPDGDYTLDPVYQPAYATLAPSEGKAARHGGSGGGAPIGLIDGGVGAHPAFKAVSIEQRGFAGDPKPSGHGTAVASLLVGHDGAFSGAAPGNPLLVADVYGGSPANGSAVAILRAMGWLASRGARVVNISLVGPPNPLLERGVRALQARGVIVVAAVGNDGPAAPPQYPASYPGVIAVTG